MAHPVRMDFFFFAPLDKHIRRSDVSVCVFVCFVSPWVIYECSGADQNNYFLGQATLDIKKRVRKFIQSV